MGKEKSGKADKGKEKSNSAKKSSTASSSASKSSKTGDKKSSKSATAKSSDSKSVAKKSSSKHAKEEEKSKSGKGQQQQQAAAAKQIKQVKGKPAKEEEAPPPPKVPPPAAKGKGKPAKSKANDDGEEGEGGGNSGGGSEMDGEESQDCSSSDQSSVPDQAVSQDSDWEGSEEGIEVEEKPKEEELTFTKPTINQMKKDKKHKEKPLSMSEKITGREFESLNDDITDLNSSIAMLRHSYGSIIKSLVAMQDRRTKKKAAKEAAQNQLTFLTTMSTANQDALKTKSCLEQTDKYDIERFLNPITREETFNALFDEVQELNGRTEPLRANCYDAKGRFLRDKYDSLAEAKLDRATYNEYKLWTKKLAGVVDDIARNYNDDLLNMFRLT